MKNKFITLLLTSLVIGFSSQCIAANNAHVLNIEHWRTQNGTHVLYVYAPEIPMVDIQVAFAAGSARDGTHPGVAQLTNTLLSQGADELDADEIARHFDKTGAQFGSSCARDMAVISLRSLNNPKVFRPALETFIKVLSKPSFPHNALQRVRKTQLAAIKQQQASPSRVASNLFYETIFHGTPYATPVLGTADSVKNINAANVFKFYRQYYVAKNAVIAIVGAVDKQYAEQISQQISSQLAMGTEAPVLPTAKQPLEGSKRHVEYPATQMNIRLGQVGISRKSPDYFPIVLGNYILGGGTLVSRLHMEVREKQGLTYGVSSQFIPMASKGPFMIALATRTDQANHAISVVKDILNQFVKSGPTNAEMKAAKEHIIGNFPLRFSSNRDIATTLLTMGFYQLPLNYLDTYRQNIRGVSRKSIVEAFKRNVDADKLIMVSVGKKPLKLNLGKQ